MKKLALFIFFISCGNPNPPDYKSYDGYISYKETCTCGKGAKRYAVKVYVQNEKVTVYFIVDEKESESYRIGDKVIVINQQQ